MDFSRFLEVIFVEGDETLPNVHRSPTKRPVGPPRPPWTCSVTIEPVCEGAKPVAVIQCPTCRHTLKSAEALEVHWRTLHAKDSLLFQSKTFSCQECEMTFPRKALLDEHKICHISVPLEPSSLNLEQSGHERKSSFQCPVCSKHFQTNRLLKQHGKIHDENRVRSHKCPECSSAFFVKYKLARHMKIHKNNVRFKDISEVQSCMMSVMDGKSMFPCSLCAKSFKSKRLLRAHQAVHAKNRERSHQCPRCSRGFYVKHQLERHLKIHDKK